MCSLGGEGDEVPQRDHRPVRDGEVCFEAPENLHLRTQAQAAPAPLTREAIDALLDRAVIDLKRAPPLAQAAALVRLVELQASLIRDLRNRVAALEGRRVTEDPE